MPKKILVGILDWGLGHATRCVPLITYLLQTQCQIFIATSGAQKKILLEAFPSLTFIDPPPYSIQYPEGGKNLVFSILKQLPRLRNLIQQEHEWVGQVIAEYGIDLIISDNRYGLYVKGLPSVIISHQLSPRSGLGSIPDKLVRKIHYQYLNNFDECWVPDQEDKEGLTGSLSHLRQMPARVQFIGPLSRLSLTPSNRSLDLLVILSGPEPARSEFEQLMRAQLQHFQGSYLLIRGLPGGDSQNNDLIDRTNEINHADIDMMSKLMSEASLVICRSGYTTIMDLVKLGKKAVLVPTPGQTEQEYLAYHLDKRNLFPYMDQGKFDLARAFARSKTYNYQRLSIDFEAYKPALQQLINKL